MGKNEITLVDIFTDILRSPLSFALEFQQKYTLTRGPPTIILYELTYYTNLWY